MLIHQLHCLRDSDDCYRIVDGNGRIPGHVVRHILPDGTKRFRAFGTDFATLADAVAEFLKVRWVRAVDLSFDGAEKVLR